MSITCENEQSPLYTDTDQMSKGIFLFVFANGENKVQQLVKNYYWKLAKSQFYNIIPPDFLTRLKFSIIWSIGKKNKRKDKKKHGILNGLERDFSIFSIYLSDWWRLSVF